MTMLIIYYVLELICNLLKPINQLFFKDELGAQKYINILDHFSINSLIRTIIAYLYALSKLVLYNIVDPLLIYKMY